VTGDSGIVIDRSGHPQKPVTFSPESPVTFGRNRRSRWTGILGHDRPESAVTMLQNTQLAILRRFAARKD